ncbi:hypothetical protein BKK81_30055 [Cupriavidus sp. USMAHM13]|uniref:DUF3562 domain-containing protein n=1 Tax=Cupriavidus malaysiensis TaxID=367825 RepID=A0A1D9IB87_9BURK|nr:MULTISPECIES: DUF3562 domain-containing protein [Cupriavidus]AOZ03330.1 hypothetical protein BKK81_30055 [Cupriavidus sp. USMAHM13]AOZ09308.1 hypothetical protein BKK80_26300 [Cupriavidus malaysiensis]
MHTQSQKELIEKIAEQTDTPLRDVENAFQEAWNDLKQEARFHDFLPLLAAKRVSERFRKLH